MVPDDHLVRKVDAVLDLSWVRAELTRRVAADLLLHLIKAVPYKIHTVLTDNGTHFTDPKGESWSVAKPARLHCGRPR